MLTGADPGFLDREFKFTRVGVVRLVNITHIYFFIFPVFFMKIQYENESYGLNPLWIRHWLTPPYYMTVHFFKVT